MNSFYVKDVSTGKIFVDGVIKAHNIYQAIDIWQDYNLRHGAGEDCSIVDYLSDGVSFVCNDQTYNLELVEISDIGLESSEKNWYLCKSAKCDVFFEKLVASTKDQALAEIGLVYSKLSDFDKSMYLKGDFYAFFATQEQVDNSDYDSFEDFIYLGGDL